MLSENSLYGHYTVMQNIDQQGLVIAEYVWIDGTGINLRSKCRTLEKKVESLADIPRWNYDGSSCYQADTENSEIILCPVAYFRDPFRQGDNILVMCETYKWEDTTYAKLIPSNTNFRKFATEIWNKKLDEEPWYGIEQEYSLLSESSKFSC